MRRHATTLRAAICTTVLCIAVLLSSEAPAPSSGSQSSSELSSRADTFSRSRIVEPHIFRALSTLPNSPSGVRTRARMGKEGHVPKAPKSKKKKKKSPAKTERKAAPLSTPDDVDDFVAGRHELKLHGNNYDDDDDDEEDEVLALQGPDSDDDEDEDEDEEGGKFDDGDEDEDEDEDAEATGTATAGWGRKKKDFYGGDSADDVSDDEAEEAARLEQEEVLRLQRDHAAGLEADDFGELDPSAEGAE